MESYLGLNPKENLDLRINYILSISRGHTSKTLRLWQDVKILGGITCLLSALKLTYLSSSTLQFILQVSFGSFKYRQYESGRFLYLVLNRSGWLFHASSIVDNQNIFISVSSPTWALGSNVFAFCDNSPLPGDWRDCSRSSWTLVLGGWYFFLLSEMICYHHFCCIGRGAPQSSQHMQSKNHFEPRNTKCVGFKQMENQGCKSPVSPLLSWGKPLVTCATCKSHGHETDIEDFLSVIKALIQKVFRAKRDGQDLPAWIPQFDVL